MRFLYVELGYVKVQTALQTTEEIFVKTTEKETGVYQKSFTLQCVFSNVSIKRLPFLSIKSEFVKHRFKSKCLSDQSARKNF